MDYHCTRLGLYCRDLRAVESDQVAIARAMLRVQQLEPHACPSVRQYRMLPTRVMWLFETAVLCAAQPMPPRPLADSARVFVVTAVVYSERQPVHQRWLLWLNSLALRASAARAGVELHVVGSDLSDYDGHGTKLDLYRNALADLVAHHNASLERDYVLLMDGGDQLFLRPLDAAFRAKYASIGADVVTAATANMWPTPDLEADAPSADVDPTPTRHRFVLSSAVFGPLGAVQRVYDAYRGSWVTFTRFQSSDQTFWNMRRVEFQHSGCGPTIEVDALQSLFLSFLPMTLHDLVWRTYNSAGFAQAPLTWHFPAWFNKYLVFPAFMLLYPLEPLALAAWLLLLAATVAVAQFYVRLARRRRFAQKVE